MSTCSSPAFIRNFMTVGIVYKCVIFSRSIISQYRSESKGENGRLSRCMRSKMYKYGLYVWLARTTVGISGNTLKEDSSGSVTQWTIHHTGVTSHPTQVCQRAKNVSGLKIKDELQKKSRSTYRTIFSPHFINIITPQDVSPYLSKGLV